MTTSPDSSDGPPASGCLARGPLARSAFRLAAPLLAANTGAVVFQIFDLAFLSRLGDEPMAAAIIINQTIWELLDVEANTGIQLTESMAMWPGASVSGIYYSHPEAQYFVVGRLGRDQIADYHQRKGMSVAELERWLSPNLNYEPGA